MSTDRSSSPISVPPANANRRRGSLSAFSEFLSKPASAGYNGPSSTLPNTMSSAAANAPADQRRRLSITTLGLSGSPTQTSPFSNTQPFRRGSLSSSLGSSPGNYEEAVMEEDPENSPPGATPHSPFARRVSFGAQALREVRGGSVGNGRYPPSPGTSRTRAHRPSQPPTPPPFSSPSSVVASTYKTIPQNEKSNPSWRQIGEGFNWSEALRTRAERAPSLGAAGFPNAPPHSQQAGHYHNHQRAASIASMEQPLREMPRQPKQNKPDFFQEKILRGDFMD
ncbi:hypothetical protein ASPZODRAFT_28849 [Penicilliopsis zonata CBS 506.65]|uniref:Uncharacterized protein n=1 Tax=Penicilliopsis zonata CBS 506.65 TaxID=1073090 RepID=A0A1L9S767_9EURO|nr:hypothetical protein ASPZODRAFT_28849 [Penicilliopsis zonata CBS 506.65]OJJ43002.1 hypothetical protein ASPZODRAFT_28849 [Penicilliopsis zonata CBS 506.65]